MRDRGLRRLDEMSSVAVEHDGFVAFRSHSNDGELWEPVLAALRIEGDVLSLHVNLDRRECILIRLADWECAIERAKESEDE
jgi:hypothetical protein